MNTDMGSLPDSKAQMNPYKETLRRQLAKTSRLDSFFEMKRRKSKKKSRHKLEPAFEEMEDGYLENLKREVRSKSESPRVGYRSTTESEISTPRPKTVTFAEERLGVGDTVRLQVLPALPRDTVHFETECKESGNSACDKNASDRDPSRENRDKPSAIVSKDERETSCSVARTKNAMEQVQNDTDTHKLICRDDPLSQMEESDMLNILQDASTIKSAYKESRSSIKTVSSMVRNVKPDKTDTVAECRKMFREEILRLRQETEDFRIMCLKQIDKQKKAVEKHRKRSLNQVTERHSKSNESVQDLESELKGLAESMEYLQHKQIVLDKETELLNREEEIEKKQKYLEDYEQEIQDVEMMLRHRKALCDRRQVALITLDEELNNLRDEIEETKSQMDKEGINTTTASERAKQNWRYSRDNGNQEWELLRRNMMDKQHVLENTVQKYRSELATISSKIVGKDIFIQKLQDQIREQEEQLKVKDKRMKNLEMKLELALAEIHKMEAKYNIISSNTNNNNNNITALDTHHFARESSQDSMILRDSSQDSGIGPRDLSPRNSQDSHTSHDSPGSRHSYRESPDSQLCVKEHRPSAGSPSSTGSNLLFPDLPGTPMSQAGSSQIQEVKSPLKTNGSYKSFISMDEESAITVCQPEAPSIKRKLRSKDKIVRHTAASRKQSIANGNLAKLSMLTKHGGDDMKSGACSVM